MANKYDLVTTLADLPEFKTRQELDDYLGQPRITCLFCGGKFLSLSAHLRQKHEIDPVEYKMAIGAPVSRGLVAPSTRQKFSESVTRTWESGALDHVKNLLPIVAEAGRAAPQRQMPAYLRREASERMKKRNGPPKGPRRIRTPLRIISRDELDAAISLVEGGLSIRQAAKQYGMSASGLLTAAGRHSDFCERLAPFRAHRHVFSHDEVETVVAKMRDGMSLTQSARTLGVAYQTFRTSAKLYPDLNGEMQAIIDMHKKMRAATLNKNKNRSSWK